MHELSLCEELLNLLLSEAEQSGARRIHRFRLRIGALGCVMQESLLFHFAQLAQGTLAEGAEIELEQVAGRGRCPDCGAESEIEHRFDPCAHCGATGLLLIAGDELRIVEMEVE